MSHPDTEQCVQSLPSFAAKRMARLVLGGWKFENVGKLYPSWKASHPNNWRKLYAASTLLTLLNQMVGVVEDTEAGVYEAFDMRGLSYPQVLDRFSKSKLWREVIVPDAADDVAAILHCDELPPR